MFHLIQEFLNSQLFGIILGAVLTGGFTFFIDCYKSKREERIYLKRKREVLYQKMYDFSMRFEKDIRIKKCVNMSKGTKDLWNEIQIESIFGNNLELSSNILEVHKQNNEKILEFYSVIKQELGIKD